MRHVCGFTLLEVLVALAVLATALYAANSVVARASRNAEHREQTLLAHWVAQDLATELLAVPPSDIPFTRNAELYGHAFRLEVDGARDDDGKIVSLAIAVHAAAAAAPVQRIELTLP